jgi:hypothetical protein
MVPVKASESMNNPSQSSTREEVEVEDLEDDNDQAPSSPIQPRKVQRVSKKRTIESDDDDDKASSSPPRKKVQVSSKKKPHRASTVKDVDNGSEDIRQKNNIKKLTGQSKKSGNTHKKGASDDSDIELIENPQESPEKELGKRIQ